LETITPYDFSKILTDAPTREDLAYRLITQVQMRMKAEKKLAREAMQGAKRQIIESKHK